MFFIIAFLSNFFKQKIDFLESFISNLVKGYSRGVRVYILLVLPCSVILG